MTNPRTEQIATKIPIAGEYGDKRVGIWYAILGALRNGFIQAIYPALDYQVSIGPVQAVDLDKEKSKEGIFKRIFGKPGAKKEKEKEKEN